jgi:hypothetical protein
VRLGLRVGRVDDVQEQVGARRLLQRRHERLDQAGRELADEPDRVGQHDLPTVGQLELPGGRVERREELVLDQHLRLGEPVEQRRLAGVGVADQRDGRDRRPLAAGRLGATDALVVPEVGLELADPAHDALAVDLELGLARATTTDAGAAGDPATRLSRQRGAPAAQAGQHVGHLRELDLGLALPARRVLREDVEDHDGPVEDLLLDPLLEVALLRRRELVVEHDRVGPEVASQVAELADLALPEVRRGVGGVALLHDAGDDLAAGGLQQRLELVERGGDVGVGPARQLHADDDGDLDLPDDVDALARRLVVDDVALEPPAGRAAELQLALPVRVGGSARVRVVEVNAGVAAQRRERLRVGEVVGPAPVGLVGAEADDPVPRQV